MFLPVAGRAIPLPSTSSRRAAARNAWRDPFSTPDALRPVDVPTVRQAGGSTACDRFRACRLGRASSLASCREGDLDRCRPHFESDRRVSHRASARHLPRRAAMMALPLGCRPGSTAASVRGRPPNPTSASRRARCPASSAGLSPRSASRFHGGFGAARTVTVPRRLSTPITGRTPRRLPSPIRSRRAAKYRPLRRASGVSSVLFRLLGRTVRSIPKKIFGEAPALLVPRNLESIARILVFATRPPLAPSPVARWRAISRRRTTSRGGVGAFDILRFPQPSAREPLHDRIRMPRLQLPKRRHQLFLLGARKAVGFSSTMIVQ